MYPAPVDMFYLRSFIPHINETKFENVSKKTIYSDWKIHHMTCGRLDNMAKTYSIRVAPWYISVQHPRWLRIVSVATGNWWLKYASESLLTKGLIIKRKVIQKYTYLVLCTSFSTRLNQCMYHAPVEIYLSTFVDHFSLPIYTDQKKKRGRQN